MGLSPIVLKMLKGIKSLQSLLSRKIAFGTFGVTALDLIKLCCLSLVHFKTNSNILQWDPFLPSQGSSFNLNSLKIIDQFIVHVYTDEFIK